MEYYVMIVIYILHSSFEHLQKLLWLISNFIALSNELWKWLTPLISSVVIRGILQTQEI